MTRGMRTAVLLAGLASAGCLSLDKPTTADPRAGIVPPVVGPGQADPPQGDLPPTEAGRVAFAMAESLEKAGSVGEAAIQYEKARQADPGLNDKAQRRLAVLYDKLDLQTRASAEYAELLARKPKDPDLLNDIGYSDYNRGRWADAEEHLRKAVKLDPGHKRAWVNLGMTLAQQGRLDESYAAFVKAVPPADALSNVGVLLAAQGKKDEARDYLQRALAQDPQHPAARAGMRLLDAPPRNEPAAADEQAKG